jgi:MtrB/PioB family decaheme-associated outer membrane protein
MMRIHTCTFVLLALSSVAAQLGAQTTQSPPARSPQEPPATAPTPANGWIDMGVRATSIDGDPARYQRYRDLGDGLFLETFRQTGERNGWMYSAGADHVARRDQRYFANLQRPGRLKVRFEWDQIPLLISEDTRTLFEDESDGVLQIDNAIRAATRGQIANLAPYLADARQFRSGSRRDTLRLGAWYAPNQDTDVRVSLTSAHREGNMPFGGSFGFGLSTELPAPIDHRTTDFDTDLEWSHGRALVGGGYHGSWFTNQVPSVTWDNPLVLTDTPAATSHGRMALWPDSTYHLVNGRGSVQLPGRSRLAAFVSLGTMRQDEALLPHTINSAIAPIALERDTADAEARTTGANLTFTSHPWRRVIVDAQYRLSDFDNRTPEFPVFGAVQYDTSVSRVASPGPEFFSIKRQNTDLEVTFMPAGLPTFRAGWRGEFGDRTHRIYETTSENMLRLSMDALNWTAFTVRALYEVGTRTGDQLDLGLLADVGEQPGMRHYDVAERDRQRVTVQATATPNGWLGVNGSLAVGKDDYKNDGEFGLRDNTNQIYTAGFTVVPGTRANVDVGYGFEKYSAFSTSRQASPGTQFNDPSRNWGTDQDDNVHTFMANAELVRPFPNTDIRFGYDYSRSRATYVYSVGVVTDRTLPEGGAPLPSLTRPDQLPPVRIHWHSATADATYAFTERLALGLSYWFENYDVEDFALANPRIAINDLPGAVLLGYRYRPYTAHTGWLRLIARW